MSYKVDQSSLAILFSFVEIVSYLPSLANYAKLA